MQFLIIESFLPENLHLIRSRFERKGRMMPAGVSYVASWIDPIGLKCYQVNEASSRDLIDDWMAAWDDIVSFEGISVVSGAEFWDSLGQTR